MRAVADFGRMNTCTDQNRKITETLRVLSAPPVTPPDSPSEATVRRFPVKMVALLISFVLLLAGAAVIISIISPDAAKMLSSTSIEDAEGGAEIPQAFPKPQSLTIAPVIREITGSGYVVAPDMTVVYAKRGGLITNILVEPGDTVKEGQPLLVVEESAMQFATEEARLKYSAAKVSLSAARISQRQAKVVLLRQTELNRRGVVAGQLQEDAETAFLIASNGVEQAQADVDKASLAVQVAEDRVSDLTVRAPITGTVTRLSAHVGDTVLDRIDAIHDGVGLLTIARLDSLAIDADMAEKAIRGLEINLKGEAVLDAFPDRPFTFALLRVAPEVNAAKGTVKVRLIPNDPPSGIRPGMAARVRIALSASNPQSTNHQGANSQ